MPRGVLCRSPSPQVAVGFLFGHFHGVERAADTHAAEDINLITVHGQGRGAAWVVERGGEGPVTDATLVIKGRHLDAAQAIAAVVAAQHIDIAIHGEGGGDEARRLEGGRLDLPGTQTTVTCDSTHFHVAVADGSRALFMAA